MLKRKQNNWKHEKGFALILVLMGLLTLTLLHTMIVQRTMQNTYGVATELMLVERSLEDVFLIDFVLQQDIETIDEKAIRLGEKDYSFRAINVSGLVDLLTADDALREALLMSMGMSRKEALQVLSTLTLESFEQNKEKALEYTQAMTAENSMGSPSLLSLATVYSGQTYLSLDASPQSLFDLLNDRLPLPDYSSIQRSTNWHVYVGDADGNRLRFLAAVHVPGNNQITRVLRS